MSNYNVKIKFYDSGEIQIHSFPNGVGSDYTEDDFLDVLPSSVSSDSSASIVSSESDVVSVPDISTYDSKDTTDYFNLMRSLRRTKNNLFDFALNNLWDFFVTFTFDSCFDRYDFDSIRKYMTTWLNHFKSNHCKDLKYIGVPEFHKDGAIHFHFLMSGSNLYDLTILSDNQKKYPGQRYTNYFPSRNFWDPVRESEKIACYMCKYVCKDMILAKGKARYIRSRNLKRPESREYWINENDVPEGLDLASYVQSVFFPDYQVVNVSNGSRESTYMRLK